MGSVTEVQPAPASLPVSERPRGSLVPLVVVTVGWMVLMVGVGFGLALASRGAWSDAAWRVIDATLIAVAFLAPSFWVHRRDPDRWFGQALFGAGFASAQIGLVALHASTPRVPVGTFEGVAVVVGLGAVAVAASWRAEWLAGIVALLAAAGIAWASAPDAVAVAATLVVFAVAGVGAAVVFRTPWPALLWCLLAPATIAASLAVIAAPARFGPFLWTLVLASATLAWSVVLRDAQPKVAGALAALVVVTTLPALLAGTGSGDAEGRAASYLALVALQAAVGMAPRLAPRPVAVMALAMAAATLVVALSRMIQGHGFVAVVMGVGLVWAILAELLDDVWPLATATVLCALSCVLWLPTAVALPFYDALDPARLSPVDVLTPLMGGLAVLIGWWNVAEKNPRPAVPWWFVTVGLLFASATVIAAGAMTTLIGDKERIGLQVAHLVVTFGLLGTATLFAHRAALFGERAERLDAPAGKVRRSEASRTAYVRAAAVVVAAVLLKVFLVDLGQLGGWPGTVSVVGVGATVVLVGGVAARGYYSRQGRPGERPQGRPGERATPTSP